MLDAIPKLLETLLSEILIHRAWRNFRVLMFLIEKEPAIKHLRVFGRCDGPPGSDIPW